MPFFCRKFYVEKYNSPFRGRGGACSSRYTKNPLLSYIFTDFGRSKPLPYHMEKTTDKPKFTNLFPRILVGSRLLGAGEAVPGDAIHAAILGQALDTLEISYRLLGGLPKDAVNREKGGILSVEGDDIPQEQLDHGDVDVFIPAAYRIIGGVAGEYVDGIGAGTLLHRSEVFAE